MAAGTVQVKVTPPVGTLVLDRPDAANAISHNMLEELRQALGDLYQEKRVRAVIVTGAGEVFCGGEDLAELATEHADTTMSDAEKLRTWGERADDLADLVGELLAFPKPVIAAVNGPAEGLGVALMMACDVVLACDTATLSISTAQQGLVAGVVLPLVAYRAGAGVAARLAVAGQTIEAAEAHRLGMYHELVKADLLWARGMEIGTQSAKGAPQAVSLSKRLLMETVGEKLLTDLASGAIAAATSRTTESAREGLQAHSEGREPVWE